MIQKRRYFAILIWHQMPFSGVCHCLTPFFGIQHCFLGVRCLFWASDTFFRRPTLYLVPTPFSGGPKVSQHDKILMLLLFKSNLDFPLCKFLHFCCLPANRKISGRKSKEEPPWDFSTLTWAIIPPANSRKTGNQQVEK